MERFNSREKRRSGDGSRTPRAGRGAGAAAAGGKRHKQMNIMGYLRSPMEETPAGQAKPAKALERGISSTGIAKLGNLALKTLQKHQVQPQPACTSGAATTQGRPCAYEPQWRGQPVQADDDGDDFIISMSQTYERTQPDPCIDYPGRDQDQDEEEPELSLRRTQHYHATSSTQPYGQDPLQLMSGMPSFSVPMGPGPVLENDLARAPHRDEAARTTWEAPDAASFTQPTLAPLPVDLSLEGQGSNAPGDPTQVPTARVASTAVPVEDPLADDTIDFRLHPHAVLPTVSAGPAVTPDIGGGAMGCCASQDVADDGTTPPLQVSVPQVYSIFNQAKSRRRPIFLIRHGESEYNAACKKGTGFGDPSDIFDAPLTMNGVKQAKSLREQVHDMMLKQGDPLFIVSPLTRAIETFLHLLPDPGRLSLPASLSSSAAPAVSQAPTQQQQQERDQGGDVTPRTGETTQSLQSKPLDVIICPTLAELLMTSGDVGRPRSVLVEKFPQLATHLRRGLEEDRWWYEKQNKGPNCAVTKVLSCTESKADCKVRVDRFKHFLYAQQLKNPQRPIVLVGHANFFKHLMGESNYMEHCVITKWAPA
ncbi:hypothetical protein HYH02_011163 [Chlamydomonas schloesseri]|uniref:Phosphoglycerate mutase-like protein n=1 Tax=Chlamydomonas schloesseri TaxID=2026947 RepID=A0A835TEX6_9CHLO|nr:hypothetical protein HYH02_011163 [Chlamydomonas schloesseri]|eukprot:KAG2437520.1 hypothetical protein HYH02_011163 [Chlamydomonas schloesseri]